MPHLRNFLIAGVASVVMTACASIPTTPASDGPSYQSAFSASDRVIGTYNLDALAKAPLRKTVAINFDKPAGDIFLPLLSRVDLYDENIVDVSFDHTNSQTPGQMGVGSVRICTFADGKKLIEPIVVYQPNEYYAYTTDRDTSTKNIPIKDVLLFYSFEDKADGSSLVTVRAHYNASNAFVSPVVGIAFGRALKQTFASAADTFGGRLIDPDA